MISDCGVLSSVLRTFAEHWQCLVWHRIGSGCHLKTSGWLQSLKRLTPILLSGEILCGSDITGTRKCLLLFPLLLSPMPGKRWSKITAKKSAKEIYRKRASDSKLEDRISLKTFGTSNNSQHLRCALLRHIVASVKSRLKLSGIGRCE